jgi:hypothetical protein
MGYTHYYSRSYTDSNGTAEYAKFREGAERIILEGVASGIKIADAFGEKLGRWENTDDRIALNGHGDDAHETFAWDSKAPPKSVPIGFITKQGEQLDRNPMDFNFCKTARKPYDAVVVALLLLLKDVYGNAVDVSSDGSWSEWQDGRDLYAKVYGVEAQAPFEDETVSI